MVKHRTIERLGRSRQPACRPQVGFARTRVAARVVVGEQNPGASVPGGIEDDVAQREIHAACIALVLRHVEAARLTIDVSDPQCFAARVLLGKAAGEEQPGAA